MLFKWKRKLVGKSNSSSPPPASRNFSALHKSVFSPHRDVDMVPFIKIAAI